MKKQNLLFVLCCLLFSCSGEPEAEEETCIAPSIGQNVIGSWDVTTPDNTTTTGVTFRNDGTGSNDTEEGPFVFYCRLNDENIVDFTWRIDTFFNEEQLFLKYRNRNCSQSNGHLILINECDQLELSTRLETIFMIRG